MLIENTILIVAALLTGIFVKLADQFEDRKKKASTLLRTITGLIYGILIFYVIYNYNFMAPLWLGTVLGLLIYGKIDGLSHYIGVGILILLTFLFPLSEVNIVLLVIFTLVNLFEELLNQFHDKKKIKNKIINNIISIRPLLEITTLIIAIYIGNIMLWIALLSFDIGYITISKIAK